MVGNQFSIRIKKREQAGILLTLILMSGALNYIMKVWETILYPEKMFSNSLYINIFFYIYFILFIVSKVINHIKKDSLLLVILFILLCITSIIINRNVEGLLFNNTLLWLFGNGLFAYIVIRHVTKWDEFLFTFIKTSRIFVWAIIISWYLTRKNINYRSSPEWYMFFSSSFLMPLIGLYLLIAKKKKITDIIAFILGAVLCFLYGSRGTLVQIVLFIFLFYIMNKKYINFAVWGICLLTLLVTIQNHVNVFFNTKLVSSSRTLSLLAVKALNTDSGRWKAYKEIINYFVDQSLGRKLFGGGIAAERPFIAKYIFNAGYVHEFFLEILLQYGIIGSVILIIILIILSVKTISQVYNKENYANVCAFLLANISVLLFSSSYLISNNLFLWMGFCSQVLNSLPQKSSRSQW